ncbi:YraN family protein [Mycetocola saprophilus]|uniref:YraN family protein n=1 Tax=Mycetocola saprophilus TaxID=76636 RepID=UPI003BF07864
MTKRRGRHSNQRVGREGEAIAADYLREHGFTVARQNWRCQYGEVDIIARDRAGTLIFVEVKTRRSRGAGDPLEAITPLKLSHMNAVAQEWRLQHRFSGRIRLDAIGVTLGVPGAPRIEHLRGVS